MYSKSLETPKSYIAHVNTLGTRQCGTRPLGMIVILGCLIKDVSKILHTLNAIRPIHWIARRLVASSSSYHAAYPGNLPVVP